MKLLEFSADQLLAGAVDCDLRYAELAVWEPLINPPRTLLGPGGLAGDIQSPLPANRCGSLMMPAIGMMLARSTGRVA